MFIIDRHHSPLMDLPVPRQYPGLHNSVYNVLYAQSCLWPSKVQWAVQKIDRAHTPSIKRNKAEMHSLCHAKHSLPTYFC